MEDEEESQSPPGRISVTVAATPPLALALPAQHPPPLRSSNNGGHFGAVGSREDCWTESATSVLIEAWGERYLNLSRGNLKQNHWKEVSDVVASREEDLFKTPKTDVQCKNRIDTVKKKFKAEKAKIASGGPPSGWPFYDRLDHLIGPTVPTPNPRPASGPSGQLLSGSGPIRSTRIQNQKLKKRKSKMESDSDPDPPSPDSTDSLPPETKYPYKRARTHREFDPHGLSTSFDFAGRSQGPPRERESSGWGDSVRELTRAIVKFGEIYEKAERAKVQHMVEMEKQRMKFTKELEIQRMQFFVKTQLEIKQNRTTQNRNNNNNNNNSHIRHRSNDNNNNNNDSRHSDSSS